jgi:di/tripeptidase
MKSADSPRRTAQSIAEVRQKRDDDVRRRITKEREALEEKVARLRALRLAKEAADAVSAVPVAAPRKPPARRTQG